MKVDGVEIRMIVGVPDEESAAATREAQYDVYVPSNANVKVKEIPGLFPERVVIHRTGESRERGETLIVKIRVVVRSELTFNTLVEITAPGIRVVKPGITNETTGIRLELAADR